MKFLHLFLLKQIIKKHIFLYSMFIYVSIVLGSKRIYIQLYIKTVVNFEQSSLSSHYIKVS